MATFVKHSVLKEIGIQGFA